MVLKTNESIARTHGKYKTYITEREKRVYLFLKHNSYFQQPLETHDGEEPNKPQKFLQNNEKIKKTHHTFMKRLTKTTQRTNCRDIWSLKIVKHWTNVSILLESLLEGLKEKI